jgi:hypothetical protein
MNLRTAFLSKNWKTPFSCGPKDRQPAVERLSWWRVNPCQRVTEQICTETYSAKKPHPYSSVIGRPYRFEPTLLASLNVTVRVFFEIWIYLEMFSSVGVGLHGL